MIDHLSLGVADLPKAIAFYDAVLEALGYVRLWTTDRAAGYGAPGGDEPLALAAAGPDARPPAPGFHLALSAPNRDAVHRFHAVALSLGARDEGAPGLRPRYGPGYYAAFVRGPDGHKLEAVIHERP